MADPALVPKGPASCFQFSVCATVRCCFGLSVRVLVSALFGHVLGRLRPHALGTLLGEAGLLIGVAASAWLAQNALSHALRVIGA